MRKAILTLGLFILLSNTAFCESIRARTEEGKTVILNSDGTWNYENPTEVSKPPMPSYTKPASAKKLFDGKILPYGIWVDTSKWKANKKKTNEDADLEFTHKSGALFAQTIAEPFTFSLEEIRQLALENLLELDSNAKIVFEERRQINGKELLCTQINADLKSLPLIYFTCFYSDNRGTIQIQTITSRKLFQQYKEEMNNFLNGFVAYEDFEQMEKEKKPEYTKKPITYYKKPLSSNKELMTERVKSRIWFDESKWKVSDHPLVQGADLSFVHLSSEIWATVLSERLQFSSNDYRDYILNYMRNSSNIKDVNILYEDKRNINGNDVLYLKIGAEVQALKVIFSMYIYAGDKGTVRITVWTMANLFNEYEKDITDFLNGMEIVQVKN